MLLNLLRNRMQNFKSNSAPKTTALFYLILKKSKRYYHGTLQRGCSASSSIQSEPVTSSQLRDFAVLLDIDGVLIRGRKPIPEAKKALQQLKDLRVPTMFLTNGGCELEKQIAERVSSIIDVEVG